ncbi:MAG: D-2-hydroxyacid dehydrogenase [Chloroflexota bacterium]|nr:D-2-hydroxyacid dehydrogenase [Chloroflexota bacterium]
MTVGPHILVYSRHPEEFGSWLTEHGCPGTVTTATSPQEVAHVLNDIEIVLCARIPANLLSNAGKLRWIQSMNAGIEDLVAADLPDGVIVTRAVDLFGGPIAEYVFAELLARVRELDRLQALQQKRTWEHFISGTLAGRTLGVAGLGSIGGEIVRKGRVFDMGVYGLSRSTTRANSVDRHFTPDRWSEFVRDLDVLVLTLPLTRETEGVVNSGVLASMRPDSILVNVGRGRVVNERDLVHALEESRIGGAILDVFEREPLPAESPLWSLPGVTVTPHISGPSTVEGVGELFLQNLRRYLDGRRLWGIVDRTLGY